MFRKMQVPPIMKANNGKERRKFYGVCAQHIRAIEPSNHFSLDTFLTIVMELKMNEVTTLNWMEYSNDSYTTPQYSEFSKFLETQARHLESATSKWKPQMTRLPCARNVGSQGILRANVAHLH